MRLCALALLFGLAAMCCGGRAEAACTGGPSSWNCISQQVAVEAAQAVPIASIAECHAYGSTVAPQQNRINQYVIVSSNPGSYSVWHDCLDTNNSSHIYASVGNYFYTSNDACPDNNPAGNTFFPQQTLYGATAASVSGSQSACATQLGDSSTWYCMATVIFSTAPTYLPARHTWTNEGFANVTGTSTLTCEPWQSVAANAIEPAILPDADQDGTPDAYDPAPNDPTNSVPAPPAPVAKAVNEAVAATGNDIINLSNLLSPELVAIENAVLSVKLAVDDGTAASQSAGVVAANAATAAGNAVVAAINAKDLSVTVNAPGTDMTATNGKLDTLHSDLSATKTLIDQINKNTKGETASGGETCATPPQFTVTDSDGNTSVVPSGSAVTAGQVAALDSWKSSCHNAAIRAAVTVQVAGNSGTTCDPGNPPIFQVTDADGNVSAIPQGSWIGPEQKKIYDAWKDKCAVGAAVPGGSLYGDEDVVPGDAIKSISSADVAATLNANAVTYSTSCPAFPSIPLGAAGTFTIPQPAGFCDFVSVIRLLMISVAYLWALRIVVR